MMDENRPHQDLADKITDKIHNGSSSSSDEEGDKPLPLPSGKPHLFGRKKPVHTVLGGGKPADIILWRDKQIAASIFSSVTVIWFIFECLDYHLLTFVCHSLMLSLAVLFLWSNLSSFANRSPPKFPEIVIPEELFVRISLSLRSEINRAFRTFRQVASGKDLKKFFKVIGILWVISVVGGWFNLLTLVYMVYVILHMAPILYEKHEEKVDALAEKAMAEINKQYAVLDKKVLQKIPSFKNAKQH